MPDKECRALFNTGTEYMVASPANKELDIYHKGIEYFERAIQCDSTFTNAYISLAFAHDLLKNYKQ